MTSTVDWALKVWWDGSPGLSKVVVLLVQCVCVRPVQICLCALVRVSVRSCVCDGVHVCVCVHVMCFDRGDNYITRVDLTVKRGGGWNCSGWDWYVVAVLLSSLLLLASPPRHPAPPFVWKTHTQICTHFKDPISIFCKRGGLAAGDVVTHKNTAYVRWNPSTQCGCLGGGDIKQMG